MGVTKRALFLSQLAFRARRSLILGLALGLVVALGPVKIAQASLSTTIGVRIDQRRATVNGETVTLDTAPVIDTAAGRTFVPVRFIGENLGAYIGWDGGAQKVTYLSGETRISLWIGQRTAQVNGVEVPLDAAPYIDENNRTLVPVRFVSEQLGATVGWDGETRTVTIRAPWVGRVVTLQNDQYSPAHLTVAVGTRITWVNLDDTEHDVGGADFVSPTITLGQAYTFTFNSAGNFDYGCSFHPDMTGMIMVQ
jgi:plastocyanin